MSENSLQVQEKREVENRGEHTRNKPVFVPAVDIYESEASLTLVLDMPGVGIEGVSIDIENDQLSIRGTVPNGTSDGSMVLHEYSVGDYYRQFSLSNAIDRSKIEATMKDGVLRMVLPKADAVKPRKIEIKAG